MLVIRGVALWLVIPVAVICWAVRAVGGARITPAQSIGWFDANFWALLERGVFRVFVRTPRSRFLRWSEMGEGRRPWRDWNGLW